MKKMMLVFSVLLVLCVSLAHAENLTPPVYHSEAFQYSSINTNLVLPRTMLPHSAFSSEDNLLYIVGENNYIVDGQKGAMAVCTDLEGAVLWEHIIPCPEGIDLCTFQSAVPLPGQRMATLKYEYRYDSNDAYVDNCEIAIIGKTGVVTLAKVTPNAIGLFAGKGGLLLASKVEKGISLSFLDYDLRTMWNMHIDEPSLSLQGIEMLSDGFIVYGGIGEIRFPANSGGSYIAKVSNTGNVLWKDKKPYDALRYYDTIMLSDNAYAAVGCEQGEDMTFGYADIHDYHGVIQAGHGYSALEYGLYQQIVTSGQDIYVAGYSYSAPIELSLLRLDYSLEFVKAWRSSPPNGTRMGVSSLSVFSTGNQLLVISQLSIDNNETGDSMPELHLLTIDIGKL